MWNIRHQDKGPHEDTAHEDYQTDKTLQFSWTLRPKPDEANHDDDQGQLCQWVTINGIFTWIQHQVVSFGPLLLN
jgi:hypothetical protein